MIDLAGACVAAPLLAAAGEAPDSGFAPEQGPAAVERPPAWALAMAPVTHWYRDQTLLLRDRTAPHDSDAWQDIIGGPIFDTDAVGVGWSEDALTLLLVTQFPDRNVVSAGRLVAPADLALDLDGDGTLETAVVLGSVRATGDRGVRRPRNVRQGQVYRVRRWHRPSDLLQHTYGQGWRWEGPGGLVLAQAAVPVWMAEGDQRHDHTASVDWLRHPDGQRWVVRIRLQFTAGSVLPVDLALVWGTAVCGNDVVFAHLARDGDMVLTSAEWLAPESDPDQGAWGDPAADAQEDLSADPARLPGRVGVGGLPRWNGHFAMVFGATAEGRKQGGPRGPATGNPGPQRQGSGGPAWFPLSGGGLTGGPVPDIGTGDPSGEPTIADWLTPPASPSTSVSVPGSWTWLPLAALALVWLRRQLWGGAKAGG